MSLLLSKFVFGLVKTNYTYDGLGAELEIVLLCSYMWVQLMGEIRNSMKRRLAFVVCQVAFSVTV